MFNDLSNISFKIGAVTSAVSFKSIVLIRDAIIYRYIVIS